MLWKNIYRETGMMRGEHRFVLTTGGYGQSILQPRHLAQSEYYVNEAFPGSADG
jgi:hypothetical protein